MAQPNSISLPETRAPYWMAYVNTALIFILFLWLSVHRNVDGDEGLYLEAARLVSQGKRLYLDFFYQQMPLLPYFFSAIGELFGFSIYPGRFFCSLLTALGAGSVLWYVAKVTKSVFVVNICALLMFASGLFLAWAPVIKTHPFNIVCLTAACVMVLCWARQEGKSLLFLMAVGFVLGIGVNSRLTLAPYPIIFLGYILARSSRDPWQNAGVFVLGFLISCLPTLYYLYLDYQLFLRYNFRFHTEIFPGMASLAFRASIAKKVFLEPQVLFLLALGYCGLILKSRQGWAEFVRSDQFFVALLVAIYVAIHLSAATPFTQYFSTIVPLLVLLVLPVLEWSLKFKSSLRSLCLAPILLVYVALAPRIYQEEQYSVGSLEPQWKLQNIDVAVRLLKRLAAPGDTCLTWWPGYAALAGCKSFPGMENHMRDHAILRGISPRLLRQYKLLPSEDLLEALQDGKVRLVVDGAYRLQTPYNDYVQYLLEENYMLRARRGGVKFYVLPTKDDIETARLASEAFEPVRLLMKRLGKKPAPDR